MSLSLSRSSTRASMRSTIWRISSWRQLVEDDDVVDAVEELGAEVLLELVLDLVLHPLVARRRVVAWAAKPRLTALGDVAGAEVGGHDDDGVLEVHDPALAVGQPAVLQDLQQRVEDVRVGLLDLVEQHHGERLAAHLLGQLAALFVPDVAGRGAEQPRDGVLLAELRHVELDQRVLVAEQELGERLGQLGLTDTGRAGEDERATGALRVLQAGAGTADRLRQRLDGVLLADDALVQLVLHAQQAGGLLLGELEDRDAGGRWPAPRRSAPRRPRRRRPCRRPSTPSPAWPSPASSCFSLSRSEAAFSKSCASIADSFSRRTSAIFSSNSRRSGGAVIRRMRSREPASSIRSIALSGRKRSEM